ncbi:tetratricopeptide repeat protein [Kaarinaea lacus]
MPVPSLPQPSSTVAKTKLETPHTTVNPSTASAATDNEPSSSSDSTIVSSTQVAEVEKENPGLKNDAPNPATVHSAGEVTSAEVVNVNSNLAAQVEIDTSQPTTVEDILQQPVISKTQPSKSVLATVTHNTHQLLNRNKHQASASITSGSPDAGVVPTQIRATSINASTVSTSGALSMVEQVPLKSESQVVEGEVPNYAVLTANDRVKNAINLLHDGDVQKAEKELADALVIEPNNRAARKLMRQLHESPADFFVDDEFFEYVLGPKDTLLSVAEKFLEDPLDFYMLAKLNDIKYPGSIVPGKTLMIPGNNHIVEQSSTTPPAMNPREVQSKLPEPIKTEEDIQIERAKVYFAEHRYQEAIDLLKPYANKQPVSRYGPLRELLAQSYLNLTEVLIKKGKLLEAQTTLESSVDVLPGNRSLTTQLSMIRNNREAERLYHLGLEESQIGKEDQALKTFAKALQLNPMHEQAKKQITDLRLTVVEEYHKQAMVLYRKQELSRAIEIWDDVLKLDPGHELAKQYRARALELQRKIEQL